VLIGKMLCSCGQTELNSIFIEINNKTDISFNKRQLKNSVNKFIEIGLLKATKQKDIYRVSRAFMWYGTEPI